MPTRLGTGEFRHVHTKEKQTQTQSLAGRHPPRHFRCWDQSKKPRNTWRAIVKAWPSVLQADAEEGKDHLQEGRDRSESPNIEFVLSLLRQVGALLWGVKGLDLESRKKYLGLSRKTFRAFPHPA